MAKLYAEITSDKGGRVVGKGGDKLITIAIENRGKKHATIRIYSDGCIDILGNKGDFITGINDIEFKRH